MVKMLKLGLVVTPDYFPRDNALELVKIAEKIGIHQISVPEMWGYDAITFLTQIAMLTKRTRISTGIVNIFSRTPSTLAQTAASLNEISNGRMTLGIGLSGPIVIEKWHGIPFEKPLLRTREYVAVLRKILNGEVVNITTKLLGNLQGFKLRIKNLKPIPIHIAAIGPKNIELCGEIADGWIPIWAPLEGFGDLLKHLKVGLEKASKTLENFEITPFTMFGVGPNVDAYFRKHLAYYVGGMGTFYYNLMQRLGFGTEADEIRSYWQKKARDRAEKAVSDEMIAHLAVTGSFDEIMEKLNKLQANNVTMPLLFFPFGSTREVVEQSMQILARIIMSSV